MKRLKEEAGGDAGGAAEGTVSGDSMDNVPYGLGSRRVKKRLKNKSIPKVTFVQFLRKAGWGPLK